MENNDSENKGNKNGTRNQLNYSFLSLLLNEWLRSDFEENTKKKNKSFINKWNNIYIWEIQIKLHEVTDFSYENILLAMGIEQNNTHPNHFSASYSCFYPFIKHPPLKPCSSISVLALLSQVNNLLYSNATCVKWWRSSGGGKRRW